MSLAQQIFSNTLWQVLLRAVSIAVGVLNIALLTRILGTVGFGYYTTIFAFLQTMMILADLGLYLSLLREVSAATDRAQESRVTSNIFTIRLLAALFILLLSPLLIYAFPYEAAVKTGVIFFALTFFFQSLISTLTAVFAKKLAMPQVVAVDLLNKVVFFLVLLYFFRNGASLNTILASSSLIYGLAFLLFYILLKRQLDLFLVVDWPYWRQIMRQSWPLAVSVVLNLVYFKADTLILSGFKDPITVALYGAPYRVLEVLVTFPHMFMSLILPVFTLAWLGKNLSRLEQAVQRSFDFFSALTVPMIVGAWLVGERLMVLLAGEEFRASGSILNILILATAAIFFGTLFTYLVVALQAQKEMIKYFLLTALVGLAAYFIFIPLYSYWAAAYITLAVEIMIAVFAYLVARRKFTFSINYLFLGKSILASLLMGIVVWLMRDLPLVFLIVFSIPVYGAAMYLLRAGDWALLKSVFNRPR